MMFINEAMTGLENGKLDEARKALDAGCSSSRGVTLSGECAVARTRLLLLEGRRNEAFSFAAAFRRANPKSSFTQF